METPASPAVKQWYRVAGIAYIFIAQFFSAFAIAAGVSPWVRVRPMFGCPADGSFSIIDLVLFAGGIAAGAWSIVRMLRPRVADVESRERWNFFGSFTHVDAASTHPSYLAVDVFVVLMLSLFLLPFPYPPAISGCDDLGGYVFSHLAVGLGAIFPLARLFAWFGLHRRVAMPGAAKPVMLFFGILSPGILLFAVLTVKQEITERRLPIVDATTFAGGLAAHPELSGQLVRLRATKKSEHAVRCACSEKDPTFCRIGAMLLDVGAGGEVIDHSAGSDSIYVFADGERPRGEVFERIGRIGPLPDPKLKPFNQTDCGWSGFGEAPAAGRAFFEPELP